jgi:RHS repeat-associated protein
MMPAAKHGDPQIGVDIHLCVVPPSPSPVPLPTPHTSIVFDPMDYIPFIGASVTVCGMKRAVAGTNGKAIHIPPGFPFAPKIPDTSDEIFMGSATVVADGDPFSFLSVMVLSCQVAGMLSPPRLKKKEKKLMLLPTVTNLAIPTNVFIGGPPTISLMGMASKLGFAALGKFAKSGLFKSIRKKLFGKMKPGFLKCKILRAEPVDIITGEVSVEQQDFTLPGRIPVEWVRTYTSNNTRQGACGYGWETPADIRLEVYSQDNSVAFLRPATAPALFPELPKVSGDDGAVLELWDGALLSDHGDEFQVWTKEDRIYHFAKAVAFTGEHGAREYPINRISDLCGNWLEFSRRGRQLIAIKESAGRQIEIEMVNGLIRQLSLFVPTEEFRHVFVQYQYDDVSNLVAVMDVFGNPYTFSYDGHQLIRHTDRNGLSFYYEFDKGEEAWRVIHSWGDGGLYNYHFEYLEELNERRITDSLGNVSLVKLDESNLPISEIDPLGGVTIFEYDDVGRTSAVIDPDGHRTGYEYDERGNLLTLMRPDGKRIQTEFNASNKAISIIDPNGAQGRQKWDARGLLMELTSPLGNVLRHEYDAQGQLICFTNARAASTKLEYDRVGNLVAIFDALGNKVGFTYDGLGNVIRSSDALGRETDYHYDLNGRLVGARLPSGARFACGYDPEGNLTSYVNENGEITVYEYHGQSEIAIRRDPDDHSVKYHYDAEERLTGVTNQRGETYFLVRDALGRIVEEIDYWGQSRRYVYSAAGYIQESVDPLGRVVRYSVDALGRITHKVLPHYDGSDAHFVESFVYDANGNLVAAQNPSIRIERKFDAEGRLIEERAGEAFIISNVYDPAANRVERRIELHDGELVYASTVRNIYNMLDEAVSIQIDGQPPIPLERDVLGYLRAVQFAPGLKQGLHYDEEGRLSAQRITRETENLVDVEYIYDATGNLTEKRDRELGIDRFIYDPVGRLTQHTDPTGKVKHYNNDPVGDRLRTRIVESLPADGPSIELGQRRSAETEPGWFREGEYDGSSYRFDKAGNLVMVSDSLGETRLRWDANQQLIESCVNGKATVYSYDPLGRRLEKRSGQQGICFYWDNDALVADCPVSEPGHEQHAGVREWVYVPETFEPFAVINGHLEAKQVYHYQNDPNGCPSRVVHPLGQVLWAAKFDGWSAVERLLADCIENPLRLQGQYFDSETRWHYNRYRYYDPGLGSYTSLDPLRLDGGTNLYSLGLNTLSWIDPVGLKCYVAVRDPTRGVVRGRRLTQKQALNRIRRGLDVIADRSSEALSLAKRALVGKPMHHGPHGPYPFFLPHYHPSQHANASHVFYP